MLYRFAPATGFRADEIRSLTRASFDLDAQTQTVTVEAAYSKRRRDHTMPVSPKLADNLRTFLPRLTPAAPAIRIPASQHQARMLRADLEAAEIMCRDDLG
jgi:integrase